MKEFKGVHSILLVGVGGQGTILISKILSAGFMQRGYDVKMSEIHGMSQRGGSVTTQIRYGDKVYSPTIGLGEANVIIAFEKAEALRALPYLKRGGILITDDHEIYPMPVLTGDAVYPYDALEKIEASGTKPIVVKAAGTAEALGNARAQNIVLLGALVTAWNLDDIDWEPLIRQYVPAKAVGINLEAFAVGKGMRSMV
ncbi:MAG: indolepyruvate oxidoreductase subunit beta [Clostridiales Family XIII bacterium]|jgi:indolepyruvate ferredoxin oxidoreductase beta subunit|nr:indolepyruvate oxidoreductase subunit beta [Clostridiales Family XIII bacterium]